MKHLRKTLALLLTFAMILPGTPGRVFAEEMYEDPAPDSGAVYAEEVLQNDAAVPVTYALSFYANAEPGTVSDYTMTVQEGQPAKLPDNWYMAPACHVFAGWQIGEQIYQPHDQIILAQSEAVVPRWEDDAAAHVWSVTGWNWAEDNTSAEAILTCTQCGGTQTAPAGVSTEELEDRTVYTAGITIGDAAYSNTREVLKEAAGQEEQDPAETEGAEENPLQPELRSLNKLSLGSGNPEVKSPLNTAGDTPTVDDGDESDEEDLEEDDSETTDVARIGDILYTSYAEALGVLQDGQTLVILNLDEGNPLVFGGKEGPKGTYTLDLNGGTIMSTGLEIYEGADVTIQNGVLDDDATVYGGKLTVAGNAVVGTAGVGNAGDAQTAPSTLVINGKVGTIDDEGAFTAGNVTVTYGTLEVNEGAAVGEIEIAAGSPAVNIKGGTVDSISAAGNSPEITISDGKVNTIEVPGNGTVKLTITGGEIGGLSVSSDNAKISISGGKFGLDVKDYLDDDHEETEEGQVVEKQLQVTIQPTPVVYNGSEQKPDITVKYGETVLTENTDYTLVWNDSEGKQVSELKEAGTYKATVNGTGSFEGKTAVSSDYTIKQAKLEDVSIDVSPGKENKPYVIGNSEPKVTVKLGSYTLPDTEYSAEFRDLDKEGTGKVIITSKGINISTGTKEGDVKVADAAVKYTAANGKVTYSETITGFSTGTYQLLKDISRDKRLVPGTFASDIILDLNGHTLTSAAPDNAILLGRKGKATSPNKFAIVDTSEGKGGKLAVNPAASAALMVSGIYNEVTVGAGVIIDGGCIAMVSENQKLDVNGTVNGGNDFAVAANGSSTNNTVININSGAVLTSNTTAVYLPGRETTKVTVSGSVTGGMTGIEIRAGELTVEPGATVRSTYSGEPSSAANGNGTTSAGAAIAIAQHTTKLPLRVVINGGTIEGPAAVYESNPQNNDETAMSTVSAEITGGVLKTTLENGSAVVTDDEKVTITGGVYSDNTSKTNVAVPEGKALAKITEGENAGMYELRDLVTVTFNSDGGSPVENAKIVKGTVVAEPEEPVKGHDVFEGWYLGEEEYDFETPVTEDIELKAQWKEATLKLSSGNKDVLVNDKETAAFGVKLNGKALTEEQLEAVKWSSDKTEIVKVNENTGVITPGANAGVATITAEYDGLTATATVTVKEPVAEVDGVGYLTLSAAISAAKGAAEKKVILLQDQNLSGIFNRFTIKATDDITLDLGGKSLTMNGAYFTLNGGKLTVTNGAINASGNMSQEFTVNSGELTIDSTAVINGTGKVSPIGIFGPATVNTAGKLTAINSFAIAGNGTAGKGGYTVNVTGGEISSENAPAIYHPNDGTVNISGGTITGTTAVYQKSGTLNITGGILHGNGEDKDYVYYGNGANATGDALVIDNCGYPGGSPATAITGGVFVSDHADAVGSYAYKENEPKTGFISGGEFSNVVPEKYCAEGYAPVEDLDGNNLYPVHKHAEHMIRVEAKKATCTEEGANPCWTCEICGKYFEDEAAQNEITESSVIIPPLKHDYVYTVLREATCTKVGVRTGTCSRDSSHTTVEVIPAAGHELEAVAAKDPTYEEDGVRAHYKCKNCGELFMDEEGKEPAEKADVIIPKLTMGLGTVSPITQPGKAEVTGGGEETVSVNYSGLELSFSKADPSIGRMIDADWTGFNVVAPKEVTKEYLQDHEVSYSNDGGKTKKSFNRNNDGTIKKGEHAGRYRLECWVPLVAEEVEAKVAGGETVADWTYKFDWDGDGEYEQTLLVKIDLANISLEGEDGEVAVRIEDGSVKVHSKLTHVEAADAKCTEAGNSEYWVCEICGEYFSDEKAENKIEENSWIIPAKDHTPGKPVIENKVASTCAKEGSYDKVVYCTECTQELRREKVSTPVSDTHDWNDWVVLVDATCSGKGVRYHVCKEKALHQEIEVIPATGKHDLLAVSKVPATCTANGTEGYYKCSHCGKLFADAAGRKEIASPASVKPLGHSWSTPVWTWSSDHSIAIARFTCSVCGETKTDIATVKQAVTPAKPGVAGKTDYTAAVTEKGRTYTDTKTAAIPALKTPDVSYRTHVQTYGWQGYVKNGEMSGTEGKSKRLEGINIKLDNLPYSGSVVYRTHVQTFGWQGWKKDGEMSGTEGKAKRLEGIQIYLTGELAKHYDIYYRVHAQTFGWLDWAKNGVMAGTSGLSKRLEGINIVLVPKGGKAPGSMARSSVCGNGTTLPENPYKEP